MKATNTSKSAASSISTPEDKIEIIFIGADTKGEEVVNSKETKKQIEKAKSYDLELFHDGEKLEWKVFDNPEEPQTLFQAILRDRKIRVDEKNIMADRPNFAILSIVSGKVVRLEYYEGHDTLELAYDIRSKELKDKKLPNFLDKDPQAYDPSKFLKETFGIPKEFSEPLLKKLHEKK